MTRLRTHRTHPKTGRAPPSIADGARRGRHAPTPCPVRDHSHLPEHNFTFALPHPYVE